MYDKGLLPGCRDIFTLDTIGKYNFHRFMRLFQNFGIRHYVLYDKDKDDARHITANQSIQNARNNFTGGVDFFPEDLEGFLGIPKSKKPHRKPQHAMLHIENKKIDLTPLADKINKLVSS